MFGYALVGSNDVERAKRFYDDLFAPFGVTSLFEHSSGGRIYGTAPGAPFFGVVAPFDGQSASAGNGSMLSLAMSSREEVNAMYAKALSLGGSDEGAPGLRGPSEHGFYGGYFRDLDGNKFCAFHTGQATG